MNRKPKPIHRRRIVSLPRWNIPHEGPLTPRLQVSERTYAIGFTAKIGPDEEEEE